MSHSIPKSFEDLENFFLANRIPTTDVAFYNHVNFIALERQQPIIREYYSAWVHLRPRSSEYEAHTRYAVSRIVEVFGENIELGLKKGVCIDAAMALMKFLEEQAIWCYGVKGALTIQSNSLIESVHFPLFDEGQKEVAGHVWVAAPPILLVDVALGNQLFTTAERALQLQQTLLEENPRNIKPWAREYLSRSLRRRYNDADAYLQSKPDDVAGKSHLPSFQVSLGSTVLRYAAGRTAISEAQNLDSLTNQTWNGRSARELYQEQIIPALTAPK